VDVTVNGEARQLPEQATVADLVDAFGGDAGRGSAVAVDGTVVPRGEWTARRLRSGDRVELVRAVQGG
jgi:sulfur carrier protein